MDGFNMLHGRKVYYGDLNLRNIVLTSNNIILTGDEESGQILNYFDFWFIDFGENMYLCDDVGLDCEREEFQNLLNNFIPARYFHI